MGKTKTNTESQDVSLADVTIKEEQLSYEDKLKNASIIAQPMAPKKLTKKCYKLIKKASKQKTFLRAGLKDVQSRIRKGETGIVIFAGDVTPVEIMCHLPGVCEEKDIPYTYTPSRNDLGSAMGMKRGSLMILVREHPDYKELYDECKEEINALAMPF
ncbi:H/ACA ribonucleoprotein complex subunit 2-like protein [Ctenocephalides felis]|uniref:H/ACA ribonucleoprotein complex subunit 2-like protein n=1 Tax=Ctenocephalides felis TaxID=7515 RepID=UPI000E6E58A1|nr:H/ACA ribonucleoprotein complex subunit 2-like protein [Ctenocephalides felis]